LFVTTSIAPDDGVFREAEALAGELGVPLVPRRRDSLSDLFRKTGMDRAVIVTKQEWRYADQAGNRFFFHPNMSALRIKHLMQGQSDPLVSVAGIKPGDHVLDCTLGMGADAIVAAYATGPQGKVVALESEPVIAAIVRRGLSTYQTEREELNRAMRRVEVVQGDYREILPTLPDESFDIVMFDPMFRETVKASAAMQALKPVANPAPLDERSVLEALRVARRAVLLKERPKSGEFERLGFEIAKLSSQYAWGVIRKGGER
jgi:16S rRNA (guanine1516-N2)-methyltransferase